MSQDADMEPARRPDWDTYFAMICRAVSVRADCRRAKHGAVIVDTHNRVLSTGYNGAPPGDPRSCLNGDCPRGLMDPSELPHLMADYRSCVALHAEQNAIANATRDCRGATIYITGEPCDMCTKLIRAAGIRRAVWPTGGWKL